MKNRYFYLIVLISSISSCTSYSQINELKLEMLNNEILSKKNFDGKDYLKIMTYDDYVYDSMVVNKINFKISNFSIKTYVLYLNNTFNDYEHLWKKSVFYNIYNSKNKIQKSEEVLTMSETMEAYGSKRSLTELELDYLNRELYQVQYKDTTGLYKIKFNRNFNYVIIHPNETKFFTYYNTLPLFRYETPIYSVYNFNHDENYLFELVLYNDSKEIEEYIVDNLRKEIEENGYMLFDGQLKSNKVPIKFVKM